MITPAPPVTDHDDFERQRLEERHHLIARGRAAGAFRNDLAPDRLVATFDAVVLAAPNQIDAGRLETERAPEVVTASLLRTCGVVPGQAST
jgi:hypothetical protein